MINPLTSIWRPVQGQNFTFLDITRTVGFFSCGSEVGVDRWMLWWLSDMAIGIGIFGIQFVVFSWFLCLIFRCSPNWSFHLSFFLITGFEPLIFLNTKPTR